MSSLMEQIKAANAARKAMEEAGKAQAQAQAQVRTDSVPEPEPEPAAPQVAVTEPVSEPVTEAPKSRPLLRPVLRSPTPTPPKPPAAPLATPAATAPRPRLTMPAGSGVAELLAASAARASSITPAAAKAVVAPTDYMPCYTVQEYIDEWNQLDIDFQGAEDDHDAMQSLNVQRHDLIVKAANRIGEIFANELAGLSVDKAHDLSLNEIANIVKLTYLRVKEAPSAWALLDRTNRAAIIQGQIAMAAKRNSSVKGKASKAAADFSASLESASTATFEGDEELLAASGFDLGDFGGM